MRAFNEKQVGRELIAVFSLSYMKWSSQFIDFQPQAPKSTPISLSWSSSDSIG